MQRRLEQDSCAISKTDQIRQTKHIAKSSKDQTFDKLMVQEQKLNSHLGLTGETAVGEAIGLQTF